MIEPLNSGQTYCVEMYISLANSSKFCTDCIGVAFSQDSLVNFGTSCELGLNFAVMNDSGIICDTVQWQLVSGEYQAQGGEQFILVGNMNTNEDCLLQPTVGSKSTWSNAGYYFIDDVSVYACTISISSDVSNSYKFGSHILNNAHGTVSFGRGFNTLNPLNNSIANSMMFSTRSNLPTLFISPSPSLNSAGNIGVGNITSPTQKLDVNGTARLRVMPNETADVLIVGKRELTDGDYSLNYLSFNGESDSYLAGDGTWQLLAVDPLCEWDEGVDDEDLVMGYSTACNEGNVGMGLDDPQAKLEVFKDRSGLNQHVVGTHIALIGTNNGGTNESRGLEIDVTGDNQEVDYDHTGIKADVLYSRRIRGLEVNTTAGVQTGENYGIQDRATFRFTKKEAENTSFDLSSFESSLDIR